MTINIITGAELKDKADFDRAIDQYISEFRDEFKKGFYQEGQRIMRKSKKQCPIDSGRLRASGRVHKPVQDMKGNVSMDLSYGTNYAVYVHENLEAYHKPPTKAKFLEDPVREELPHMVENIIARVNKLKGAKQ